MTVLICSGLFIIILLKYSNTGIYKNKKRFCIIIFGYLFLICALKSNTYGDIPGYIRHYEEYSLCSYNRLWSLYTNGLLKDFGFYFVAKILNNIGVPVATRIQIILFYQY